MAASQVLHPTRATVRTVVAAVIAFAGVFPALVNAVDLPEWSGVTAAVAFAGLVTRAMAAPGVEAFLQEFAPFLAASPKEIAQAEAIAAQAPAIVATTVNAAKVVVADVHAGNDVAAVTDVLASGTEVVSAIQNAIAANQAPTEQ